MAQRAHQLGVSAHELARGYVLERLQEAEERAALREAVAALQAELSDVRADLVLAVEALLVSAGRVPPAEARTWVEENFRLEAQPPGV